MIFVAEGSCNRTISGLWMQIRFSSSIVAIWLLFKLAWKILSLWVIVAMGSIPFESLVVVVCGCRWDSWGYLVSGHEAKS